MICFFVNRSIGLPTDLLIHRSVDWLTESWINHSVAWLAWWFVDWYQSIDWLVHRSVESSIDLYLDPLICLSIILFVTMTLFYSYRRSFQSSQVQADHEMEGDLWVIPTNHAKLLRRGNPFPMYQALANVNSVNSISLRSPISFGAS